MTAAYDLSGLEDQPPKRKGKLQKWQPKKWRLEYERIVAMSATGMSNSMIAKEIGFCKEYVSTILNLPEAEELRIGILEKFRSKTTMVDIPSGLAEIAEKGVERINKIVNDDDLFNKSPFQVAGVAMEVLKGLRHLRTNTDSGTNIEKAVIISGGDLNNLFDGLKKANQVREIHAKIEDAAG